MRSGDGSGEDIVELRAALTDLLAPPPKPMPAPPAPPASVVSVASAVTATSAASNVTALLGPGGSSARALGPSALALGSSSSVEPWADSSPALWEETASVAMLNLGIVPEDSISCVALGEQEPLPKFRKGGRQGTGGRNFSSKEERMEYFKACAAARAQGQTKPPPPAVPKKAQAPLLGAPSALALGNSSALALGASTKASGSSALGATTKSSALALATVPEEGRACWLFYSRSLGREYWTDREPTSADIFYWAAQGWDLQI